MPEATADQQHRDHPDQQQRRPDTGTGHAHQGAVKDRPGRQGQRGNDWQQAEVSSGQRPADQPKQGRRGDEQANGPLHRGVVGALPEQPGGGGDQQEEPGQLGRPVLRHAVGTGVASTCARYNHATPDQIGCTGRPCRDALLYGEGP